MIRRIVLLLASSAATLLMIGGLGRVLFASVTPVSSAMTIAGGARSAVLLWMVGGACVLEASLASRAVLLLRRPGGGRDVVRPVGLIGSFPGTGRPRADDALAPLPTRHGVYFYDKDDEIVSAVADAFAPAMEAGALILLVATGDHVDAVGAELRRRGLHPDPRSYLTFDASETLRSIMVRGVPDRARFEAVVGTLVEELTFRGPLYVYGEMVNLLWERGHVAAALRLERFWNDLGTRFDFSLLCGYRAIDADDAAVIDDICDTHSHLVGSLH